MSGDIKRLLPAIDSTRPAMLFALVLVVFYNAATWKTLHDLVPLQGLKGFAFFASLVALLWTALTLLLTLVFFHPLLKPALTLTALCSIGAIHFMGSYGTSIDTVMVRNVFETNATETGDLVNPTLLGYLLLLGVLPSLLIWLWPVRYRPFFRSLLGRVLILLGCLLIVAAMVGSFYSACTPILHEEDRLTHFINPTDYIYTVDKCARQRLVIKEHLVVEPIGLDTHQAPAALQRQGGSLLVFVVGETARADHFSLNGYARGTNPELGKQDIINFTQVRSCGTSTTVSAPCMFPRYPREDYSDKKARTHKGLLDTLRRAGVQMLWLESNSDCKGTCLRVSNRDISRTQPSPFYDGKNCLDESLLVDLQEYIDGLQDGAIIVLHSDGSHGPEYYERYPKEMERFRPVCRTNRLGSRSKEELVNVYDNAILYTDRFLAKVIELFKRNADGRDTVMIYMSDRGESLDENGIYLHATPYSITPQAQTHVPMVMWFAPRASGNWDIQRSYLDDKRGNKDPSRDNLFRSMLDLLDVQTSLYQPALDIFASCRAPRAAQ